MTPAGLWLRVAVAVSAATAGLVLLEVPAPTASSVPLGPALVFGGAGLYLVVARRRPHLRLAPDRVAATARAAFLAVWAVQEEVVWRRLVLAEFAARSSVPLALLTTAAIFGWLHAGSRLLHCATGLVFGGVYVLTGQLTAAIAAHLTYNLLVAGGSAADRRHAAPA